MFYFAILVTASLRNSQISFVKLQVIEADEDAADEHRGKGFKALADGDWPTAVAQLTTAIELNPKSAVFLAKRATALLKLNRPLAAIKDCDRAIELNPDSALAYKNRGRANQYVLLGRESQCAQTSGQVRAGLRRPGAVVQDRLRRDGQRVDEAGGGECESCFRILFPSL